MLGLLIFPLREKKCFIKERKTKKRTNIINLIINNPKSLNIPETLKSDLIASATSWAFPPNVT